MLTSGDYAQFYACLAIMRKPNCSCSLQLHIHQFLTTPNILLVHHIMQLETSAKCQVHCTHSKVIIIMITELGSILYERLSTSCTNWLDNYDVNAVCTDTATSFECACVSGYSGDGVNCTGKISFSLCLLLMILWAEQRHLQSHTIIKSLVTFSYRYWQDILMRFIN